MRRRVRGAQVRRRLSDRFDEDQPGRQGAHLVELVLARRIGGGNRNCCEVKKRERVS